MLEVTWEGYEEVEFELTLLGRQEVAFSAELGTRTSIKIYFAGIIDFLCAITFA